MPAAGSQARRAGRRDAADVVAQRQLPGRAEVQVDDRAAVTAAEPDQVRRRGAARHVDPGGSPQLRVAAGQGLVRVGGRAGARFLRAVGTGVRVRGLRGQARHSSSTADRSPVSNPSENSVPRAGVITVSVPLARCSRPRRRPRPGRCTGARRHRRVGVGRAARSRSPSRSGARGSRPRPRCRWRPSRTGRPGTDVTLVVVGRAGRGRRDRVRLGGGGRLVARRGHVARPVRTRSPCSCTRCPGAARCRCRRWCCRARWPSRSCRGRPCNR